MKHLILSLMVLAIVPTYASNQIATLDQGSNYIDTYEMEKPLGHELQENGPIANDEKSNYDSWNYDTPIWLSALTIFIVFFVFLLFCKVTWLALEVTNYHYWRQDMWIDYKNQHMYTFESRTMYLHHKSKFEQKYPRISAFRYIFNFKIWRLQDALNAFTYDEYQKWSNSKYN